MKALETPEEIKDEKEPEIPKGADYQVSIIGTGFFKPFRKVTKFRNVLYHNIQANTFMFDADPVRDEEGKLVLKPDGTTNHNIIASYPSHLVIVEKICS